MTGESAAHTAADTSPSREAFIASPIPIASELLRLFPHREARVVFDIGSCEGEDAIRYAALFPSATVFAFEPLPENIELLKANLSRHGNPNVRVMEIALSDRRGQSKFHVSSGQPDGIAPSDWDYGNKSSSLLAPDRHLEVHPWVHFDRQIEVETDTIEGVCAQAGIDHIDLVHLDVQGAELKVLQGAGSLLNRIGAIWMEVEAIPLYQAQPLRAEVERFMSSHGFRLMLSTVDAVSGDQLYYNADLVGRHADPLSFARSILRKVPGVRRAVRFGRLTGARLVLEPLRERREVSRWRQSGSPVPPPAAFKRRVVRAYGRAFGLTRLIESGTYLGDMVEAQRGRFREVWSIELSPDLYEAAAQRFESATSVTLFEGDSGDLLPDLLARLDAAALFYLDGHFSAGVTARGTLETPIRRELEAILSSEYDHCLLVDDARCFGTGDYPTLDDVRELVRQRRPNWVCAVQDDIIRIHPPIRQARKLSTGTGRS